MTTETPAADPENPPCPGEVEPTPALVEIGRFLCTDDGYRDAAAWGAYADELEEQADPRWAWTLAFVRATVIPDALGERPAEAVRKRAFHLMNDIRRAKPPVPPGVWAPALDSIGHRGWRVLVNVPVCLSHLLRADSGATTPGGWVSGGTSIYGSDGRPLTGMYQKQIPLTVAENTLRIRGVARIRFALGLPGVKPVVVRLPDAEREEDATEPPRLTQADYAEMARRVDL